MDRPRVTRPRFDPDGLDSAELDSAVRQAMQAHGSVYAIDRDRMRELAPDVVLTQAVCDVCAVPANEARSVAEDLDPRPQVVSLDAHTIGDILETVRQVGAAAGVRDRAEAYVAELRGRLDRVRERVAGADRPRVLAIEWLAPPFLPGHWVPEMVEMAGGVNLAGTTGARSVQADWEELEGLDPDALVVMPCGYDLEAARRDADAHSDRLRAIAPRAIEDGRAFVVDASSYFNRSGPRVVDGVEILAALLHPGRFSEIDLADRGAGWRPPGMDG